MRHLPCVSLATEPYRPTACDPPDPTANYSLLTANSAFASGWQKFSYGKLGELTENIRTFALPFENQTYTFKMNFEYDSWKICASRTKREPVFSSEAQPNLREANRIQTMTYPDGEVVHYDYNRGGMLTKVYGTVIGEFTPLYPSIPRDSMMPLNPHGLNGQATLNSLPVIVDPIPLYTTHTYPYIDSIVYNEFELKSEVFYGNGTHTQYDYDSIQRLQILQSQTRAGVDMQDITYTYDAVSNITGIVNAANYPGMNLGGTYSHSYEYDDLYRLTYSTGTWEDRPYHLGLVDTVRMAYHKNGRIARKNVFALTMSSSQMGVTNYNRRYDYNGQQNTLANVYDSVANTNQNFSWDNSGNMVAHNGRSLTWTEDNRLQMVTDNEWFSYYQYDAGGDRTYKLPYNRTISNRSGRISYYWAACDATLYASPYLVVTPKGYTKHYYAENERITSQIGRGTFSTLATPVTDTATANRKVRRADSLLLALNPAITDTVAQLSYLTTLTNRQKDTCEAYWYHTDHLGSSSWVTDSAGNPVQHLQYLPWGEDFVNQRCTGWSAMYTFSAKEKDTETGYSYFGSRYYSSDLSVWLSVDPQAAKYPSLSPYTYCANNPIRLVDPNGEEIVGTDGKAVTYSYNEKGDVVWSTNASDDTKRIGNAMLQTKTGKEQLDFLISGTKTKITMKISADNRGDVMGDMIPGKATKNKDGSIDLKSATIIIYEGSIINYLNKDNTKTDNMISDNTTMGMLVRETNPTIDQFIGAEACHEAEHVRPDNLRLNYGKAKTEEVEKLLNQKKASYLHQLWRSKQKSN